MWRRVRLMGLILLTAALAVAGIYGLSTKARQAGFEEGFWNEVLDLNLGA